MSDKKGGCQGKAKKQFFGLGLLVVALAVVLLISCAVPDEMSEQTGSVEGDISLLGTMLCPFMIFMFVIVYAASRWTGGPPDNGGRGLG